VIVDYVPGSIAVWRNSSLRAYCDNLARVQQGETPMPIETTESSSFVGNPRSGLVVADPPSAQRLISEATDIARQLRNEQDESDARGHYSDAIHRWRWPDEPGH
jgi:2'-5' RNA ligase